MLLFMASREAVALEIRRRRNVPLHSAFNLASHFAWSAQTFNESNELHPSLCKFQLASVRNCDNFRFVGLSVPLQAFPSSLWRLLAEMCLTFPHRSSFSSELPASGEEDGMHLPCSTNLTLVCCFAIITLRHSFHPFDYRSADVRTDSQKNARLHSPSSKCALHNTSSNVFIPF